MNTEILQGIQNKKPLWIYAYKNCGVILKIISEQNV